MSTGVTLDARRPVARRDLGAGLVRRSAGTTPGLLWTMLGGLLALTVIAALVGWLAAGAANGGTKRVSGTTEPLLVNAEAIYTALADADATAAQAFLSGGLPPTAQTQRYKDDIAQAGSQIAAAAAKAGDSGDAAAAISALTSQLPVYTGLIEAARANNRQGFPVGASYLAQASALNRSQLLPAAQRLFTQEQSDLADDYHSARATAGAVAAGLLLLLLVGALVLAQLRLYRRTHRVLNLPLVAATVLAVVLFAVFTGVFATQHSRLGRAQADGSDPVGVLARARIAALRQRADESLTLVARGSTDEYEKDFAEQQGALDGTGGSVGLIDVAVRQANESSDPAAARRVADVQTAAQAYATLHGQVRKLDDSGDYNGAVSLATSSAPTSAPAVFAALDTALANAIVADQHSFEDAAGDAGGGLGALGWFVPVAGLAIAGLAILGLRARLREYR
jgi:hypothetical protein